MDWRESTVSLVNDDNESIFTQILRPNSTKTKEDPKTQNINQKKHTILDKSFDSLPSLQKNQIYLFIDIIGPPFNNSENNLNKGVIPLEIPTKSQIKIGREHFIHALWKDPGFFEEYPLIFENIASLPEGGQFYIKNNNSEKFSVNANIEAVNIILDKISQDFSFQMMNKEQFSLTLEKPFYIPIFYPLRDQSAKNFNKFYIQIKASKINF